jgi:hypothetical protein
MARKSGPLFFIPEGGKKVEWLPDMLLAFGDAAIRDQSEKP